MADRSDARTMFTQLDRIDTDMADAAIDALDRMAGSAEIRRVRQEAERVLAPVPGQRLLDAGCGLGEVARHLAERVAPGGEVLALDTSATVLSAARKRHDGSAVTYLQADVVRLGLPDDAFDGVRAERVLQHLAEPDQAVAELVRVTRPGGRVCLIDTDWESSTADGLPRELFAELRELFFERFVLYHRDMGRTLRRRLVGAGATDVDAVPVTLSWTDPDTAGVDLPLFNRLAVQGTGLLPDDLAERWLAAIDRATARSEFLVAITMWVAAGRVPGER